MSFWSNKNQILGHSPYTISWVWGLVRSEHVDMKFAYMVIILVTAMTEPKQKFALTVQYGDGLILICM